MSSYTPGPWDRTGLLIVSNKYKEAGSNKINLEIAAAGGRTDEEAVANARLMAAAPELVDRLAELVNAVERVNSVNGLFGAMGGPVHVKSEILEGAKALLRRIEGEGNA